MTACANSDRGKHNNVPQEVGQSVTYGKNPRNPTRAESRRQKARSKKQETKTLGVEDGIGRDAGDSFDPSFGGSEAFEQLCQVYPKAERGTRTAELYMLRVHEVAKKRGVDSQEASAHALNRAKRYASLVRPVFTVRLRTWLDECIYDQPDAAWDQSAPPPIRHQPSVSDRMRAQREADAE